MSQPFRHLELDDFSNLIYRTPSYMQYPGEVSWVFWHLETSTFNTFKNFSDRLLGGVPTTLTSLACAAAGDYVAPQVSPLGSEGDWGDC